MTAADVLLALLEAGAALWVEGDRLRFRAPVGALDAALRERAAATRPALIALVRAGAALERDVERWPEALRHAREERAGALQFDGGLSAEAAGREAERLARVEHARAFVARAALVVDPAAAAVAARPGGGPHRR